MYELTALSRADQELVTRIKQKVDGIAMLSAQENDPCKPELYPPASIEEIQWAEAGIGAPLPPLIREIFLQVGNGGFGPGYGITGLINGRQINNRSFVENVQNTVAEIKTHLRESIQSAAQLDPAHAKYIEQDKRHYENWNRLGLDHLIWYCDFGHNICTLVDYSQPDLPLYRADSLDVGEEPSKTLRQWWREWLNA